MAELALGHAQGLEHGVGAAVVDGVGAQGVEQLIEHFLDSPAIVERGQGEAAFVTATADAGGIAGVGYLPGVEVTIVAPRRAGEPQGTSSCLMKLQVG